MWKYYFSSAGFFLWSVKKEAVFFLLRFWAPPQSRPEWTCCFALYKWRTLNVYYLTLLLSYYSIALCEALRTYNNNMDLRRTNTFLIWSEKKEGWWRFLDIIATRADLVHDVTDTGDWAEHGNTHGGVLLWLSNVNCWQTGREFDFRVFKS